MSRLVGWLALIALVAQAAPRDSEWKLIRDDGVAVIKNPRYPLIEIFTGADKGGPRVIEAREIPETKGRIEVVIFERGVAGTSQLYAVQRAAVIDKKNSALLGIYAWKWIPVGDSKPTPQPEWKWQRNSLDVIDPDRGPQHLSWN